VRLKPKELKTYRIYLAERYRTCQIGAKGCTGIPEDTHHLIFGCYGANKDDTSLICVCRSCHNWAHANKHLSQYKFLETAKKNWSDYAVEV
jgi:hypothetical protein